MKFGEGRDFFDTILKTEKELGGAELEAGGGKRRAGGGKGGAGGYKLAAGEKGRWMAPNWYWEAPGSGGGKSGKGRGGGRERQGVGMSGKEAVQRSRKQRNRRGIPKGRTNNSDKHRSSLPNPGRENASRGRVGRYPPGERRGEIAIWGRAGWAVAGGGDPASARAPARGDQRGLPKSFFFSVMHHAVVLLTILNVILHTMTRHGISDQRGSQK
ncbi:hypothetical protein B0H14DRAFT_2588538 [Mycena olivaceomarginata]|nr:hypothetical protein B0H14DRAFT_2588538 [Mycena olivaceomarginata]